jgi:hypothetical protein
MELKATKVIDFMAENHENSKTKLHSHQIEKKNCVTRLSYRTKVHKKLFFDLKATRVSDSVSFI